MDYAHAKNEPGVNLIEFYASWCPHCQRMMPIVDEVRELVNGRASVYQYDIDQHPDWAEQAGAESVPTFILYRSGKELWRQSGEIPGDELLAFVNKAID